jgi:hypothetical protein
VIENPCWGRRNYAAEFDGSGIFLRDSGFVQLIIQAGLAEKRGEPLNFTLGFAMSGISILLPVLLVVRIILDFVYVASNNSSYRFDFAYFVGFLIAGIVMVSDGPLDVWATLSFGIAIFSLIQFFIRRAKYVRTKDSSPI